ncbi:RNA polymerase sigma-70 factor (ECF subfamily) [Plantactinospora soyae]|uniref:RNA polymerase sigma-70 factor (ECF subfamily) n=1 Tax=Plantactinospora soyae TaxID=1544732 RepID=A0A927R421_9ACTN|nr:sigma-70 family RNA polymerase sigma factor [Plantactinospora soyae]MBE1484606.1 RNA polymerase sigma-70 factor (ECF subfamily) [Plantactinospora soyae]
MARAPSSATRFEDLYRSCYQDLLGYALRRVDRPQDAADVVADTFLVAWRRIDEIPPDRARPWLFGVARNVMANQHRADRRRADLAERLRQELSQATVVQPDVPASLGAAFAALTEGDREVLRLVAWEGLSAEDLAVTLDCSVNAARIRLHRARKRLADALTLTAVTTPLRSSDA